jgi:hypothetical protein
MSETARRSRRGFLGLAGRVGVAVVGGMAGVLATGQGAKADGFCNYTPACCCLKHYPGSCPGSGSSHGCPPGGWVKKHWVCCSGLYMYGCGECVKSSSCWNGPYICSEYWRVGRCPL